MKSIAPRIPDYREVLQNELQARQSRNSNYSLRAFARDLQISPASLSLIFSRKQGLTRSKACALAARLSWGPDQQQWLGDLVEAVHARSPGKREAAARRVAQAEGKYELALENFRVIADPEHFCILEAVSLPGVNESVEAIAQALGLSVKRAREAVERLLDLGLLRQDLEGRFQATDRRTVVPGGALSVTAIQRFHSGLLELALTALKDQSAENRNFTSTVLACRKSDLPRVRERVREFEKALIAEFGTVADKDSIYSFGTQFFEVSVPRKRKKEINGEVQKSV